MAAYSTDVHRPRLLFIRPETDRLPAYIANHFREQEACLSLFFDVTVAPAEGSYKALCETVKPDLAMFESGVYVEAERTIHDTEAYPEIPKLGFLNADAYCPTRSVFLADMERWGIDTFFTHGVSMPGYTPQIADRLFVWPNSIDPSVYRDYGAEKVVPVLAAGSRAPHYPWRNQVLDQISRTYPTLKMPHFGWFNAARTQRMVYGEGYARLINSATIAPTCGTIANELVRKHLEVPGCRTLLVTEGTPAVREAGFVDMENCVFVEPADALDKIDHLFSNPELLQAITDRGYELVHRRHTWRNRDQIRQWLDLHRRRQPGERIVQLGPFDGLALVAEHSGQCTRHVDPQGLDRVLLAEAQDLYATRRYLAAERLYLRCMNYNPTSAEAHLGLALLALQRGDGQSALDRLQTMVATSLRVHRADTPDPVEWAYLLVALLCLGRTEDAVAHAAQHPRLSHPELAWARQAVAVVAGGRSPSGQPSGPARASLHRIAPRDEAEWFAEVATFLQRSGRAADADRLRRVRAGAAPAAPAKPSSEPRPVKALARRSGLVEKLRRHAMRTLADFDYPRRYLAKGGAPAAFAAEVWKAAVSSDIHSVMLAAERPWSPASEALLSAIRANPAFPTLLRLGARGSLSVQEPGADPAGPPGAVASERLRQLMLARSLSRFDLVVIDGRAPPGLEAEAALRQSGVVMVDRLDEETNQLIAQALLAAPEYQLTESDPSANGGYAVFRRVMADAAPERRSRLHALAGAIRE